MPAVPAAADHQRIVGSDVEESRLQDASHDECGGRPIARPAPTCTSAERRINTSESATCSEICDAARCGCTQVLQNKRAARLTHAGGNTADREKRPTAANTKITKHTKITKYTT
jgi:hypothetical protein